MVRIRLEPPLNPSSIDTMLEGFFLFGLFEKKLNGLAERDFAPVCESRPGIDENRH